MPIRSDSSIGRPARRKGALNSLFAGYELVGEGAGGRIQVNFSNCVHCKTCGILDPIDALSTDAIQNIEWRAPAEGGPACKGL